MGSAYYGHGPEWKWSTCKCKVPIWERILDLVLCKNCNGRRGGLMQLKEKKK